MKDAIHQRYASLRKSVSPATPIVLLHIGDEHTWVASGSGVEPDQVLLLEMGAKRTSIEFFKHIPPSPLEIENAITAVEDEVTRACVVTREHGPLYSTDERVDDMPRMLGYSDGLAGVLSIEQVESLFEQLAARSEGRPASQVDIPDDPRFTATLLILREFMHHLNFHNVKFMRNLQQMGGPTSNTPESC